MVNLGSGTGRAKLLLGLYAFPEDFHKLPEGIKRTKLGL